MIEVSDSSLSHCQTNGCRRKELPLLAPTTGAIGFMAISVPYVSVIASWLDVSGMVQGELGVAFYIKKTWFYAYYSAHSKKQ
jgi:hypothetical protein